VSLHQEVVVSNWKIDEQAAGRIVLSAAKMAKQYSVSAAKLDSKANRSSFLRLPKDGCRIVELPVF